MSTPISRGLFLAVVVSSALPAAASAQAWADAYRAGNYENAADLLHQAVIDSNLDVPNVDPEPHRQLAVMYALGQGVTADPIAACALAQMSGMAVHMRPGPPGEDFKAYQARLDASEDFVRRYCEPLSREDRLTASRSVGCFAFGMREQVVTVGDRSVRIGRRGIGPAPLDCVVLVAGVRITTVLPPDDAVPGVKERHFVQIFSWHMRKDSQTAIPSYPLTWHVYELLPDRVELPVSIQGLFTLSTWPPRELLPELEKRLSLQMIRSGHVRWTFEGTPPKRGWIMLRDDKNR